MFKKLCFTALALVLVLAMVTGCAQGAGSEPAQSTAPPAESGSSEEVATPPDGSEYPLAEAATIKVLTPQTFSTQKDLSEILPIFQKVEEETNIHVEWTVLTPDYNVAVQTMLAAGDVDADMVNVPAELSPAKYIEAGLFQPVGPLVEQYAPNMKTVYEARDDIKSLCTYNGEFYLLANRFGYDEEGSGMRAPIEWVMANFIRSDYLEEIGKDVPETMDDLYEVLTQWKQDNPDYFPWAVRNGYENGGNGTIMSLAGAYGIYLGNGDANDFYPENGTIVYQWTKPETKEYLTEMAKWYAEGLINPGHVSSKDQEKAFADIVNGQAVFAQGWATELPAYGWHKTTDGGSMIPMKVPAGPNGDRITLDSAAGIMTGYSAILANSENAEYVVRWLDQAVYSPLGLVRGYWGLEGETYDMVNGEPKLKDEFIAQDDWTSKLFDYGTQMYVLPIPFSLQQTAAYDKITYDANDIGYQWDITITMKDDALSPYYSPLPTPEEEATVSKYSADIRTYRNEMVAKFVMGTESLDNFDAFVETLNGMGLTELTKIEQDKYDRSMA